MDSTNLSLVNELYAEARSITAALHGFDNGGVIVSMNVSAGPLTQIEDERFRPPGRLPVGGTSVDTRSISYPPEMVEAIRQALDTRYGQINSELESLGLTVLR